MDKHYHPLILQRLKSIFASRDWEGLKAYLAGLSNAHFRTAGYLIGERLLAEAGEEDFWTVMLQLVLWQPRAFVVTTAKAATPRLLAGTLSLEAAGCQQLCEVLRKEERWIDSQKILLQWLPAATEPATIERLFALLGVEEARRRADFLLRTDSVAAGFVLLRTLRLEEHDREWQAATCRALMRRGDSLSFNLASMIRAFFDLQEVKGVFSLQIEPFELSRLDTDFETFRRLLRKV